MEGEVEMVVGAKMEVSKRGVETSMGGFGGVTDAQRFDECVARH